MIKTRAHELFKYGERVTSKSVPEARGVICSDDTKNPLGNDGILNDHMIWVRWANGVAYSWNVDDLVKLGSKREV